MALVVLAGVIDARERRLPNMLAAVLAVAAAAYALSAGGAATLGRNALAALVMCGALVAFELWWRARHGVAGQGMGDLKALAALMLAAPWCAVAAYAAALVVLAVAGMVLRQRALPLLPFLAVTFVLLCVAGGLG